MASFPLPLLSILNIKILYTALYICDLEASQNSNVRLWKVPTRYQLFHGNCRCKARGSASITAQSRATTRSHKCLPPQQTNYNHQNLKQGIDLDDSIFGKSFRGTCSLTITMYMTDCTVCQKAFFIQWPKLYQSKCDVDRGFDVVSWKSIHAQMFWEGSADL